MTREYLIYFEPVFNAIKKGKNVQIYTNDLHYHERGWWKTVDNWGFGNCDISNFRIKNNDGSVIYFHESSKNKNQNDLDEPEKYCKNYYNYL